jgi:hypothetical protein
MPLPQKVFSRLVVRSTNWSIRTISPGTISSCSEPTAEMAMIHDTPRAFIPKMLAR